MKEAKLYKKLKEQKVECSACSHRCKILPRKTGICGVRQNRGGKLYLLVYGRVVAAHVDPVEKKPLYHFLPGSKAFSIGTLGCNFRCLNCQNFDISQIDGHKGDTSFYRQVDWGMNLSPQDVVREAKKTGCQSIAYTYNEPAIWAEYALDTMKFARKAGFKNIWVSNGFMTEETLNFVAPYLDAVNVDIKSFDDEFYRSNCGTRLEPVLETCQRVHQRKIHLEVTTLIIPTLSDDEKMLRRIAKFIKIKLSPEVPWHISAFSGAISWKLPNLPDTSLEKIRRAYKIGKDEGLKYVYGGNIIADSLEDTACPECRTIIIRRSGYAIDNNLIKGKCQKCKTRIHGVFDD